MLCHVHKCIFVHVPKTAGQSVEHVFLSRRGLTWKSRDQLLLLPNRDPRRGPTRLSHLTACEYLQYGYVTPEQFQSYFKFAFVRNPWDRLVSEYKYLRLPERFDFKTYLMKHLPEPGWTSVYRHRIPQYDFVYDDQGRRVVDFVGKFENLQSDFDQVCRHLGIPATPLPHINRSLKRAGPNPVLQTLRQIRDKATGREARRQKNTFPHYSQYYDAESREVVAEMYRKDIEAFGYQFENPPAAGRSQNV